MFSIPNYFVYTSRAFATFEGIRLSSDDNYSILKECFPYLAKRLLSDDSPHAREALRTIDNISQRTKQALEKSGIMLEDNKLPSREKALKVLNDLLVDNVANKEQFVAVFDSLSQAARSTVTQKF